MSELNNETDRKTKKEIEERNSRPVIDRNSDSYDEDYNPLAIDPGYKLEGYSYKWVRKDIRGVADTNFETHIAQGWLEVPRNRIKTANYHDPLNRNVDSREFICTRDLILMEIPQYIVDRYKKRTDNMIQDSARALKHVVRESENYNNYR